MRLVLLPLIAALLIGASEPDKTIAERSSTEEGLQDIGGTAGSPDEINRKTCRDRIRLVREERGLPDLNYDTADADEPLFIAAVDHQVDGCDVLVMREDTSDIRPLPRFDDRSVSLIPAR